MSNLFCITTAAFWAIARRGFWSPHGIAGESFPAGLAFIFLAATEAEAALDDVVGLTGGALHGKTLSNDRVLRWIFD